MNWLTNFVKPKIQALINKKIDVAENLWTKCNKCEHMLFHRDLQENLGVCHHCENHMRISAKDRLKNLFDNGLYTLMFFRNRKPVIITIDDKFPATEEVSKFKL